MRTHRRHALPGLLLSAAACARPWLEATMARHMAIELPLLFALGWLAAHVAGPRFARALSPWNANGLPALLGALLVTGFWMLPIALDMAMLDGRVGVLKVASMVTAGAAIGASWRSAGVFVQAFAVFNWVWMTLTIGLLYQDAPVQLCSVYLSDQQASAGSAVVALSVAALAAWLAQAFYQLSSREVRAATSRA